MIIITEKRTLKTANDAISSIATEMECLAIALKGLEIIFFDNTYKKKEARKIDLRPHLEVYNTVHGRVLAHLINIEAAIAFLKNKLAETPPIEVAKSGIIKIQKYAITIKTQIDSYEKKIINVKHLMPHFTIEVSRLGKDVNTINEAINTINGKNVLYPRWVRPLIRNPFV